MPIKVHTSQLSLLPTAPHKRQHRPSRNGERELKQVRRALPHGATFPLYTPVNLKDVTKEALRQQRKQAGRTECLGRVPQGRMGAESQGASSPSRGQCWSSAHTGPGLEALTEREMRNLARRAPVLHNPTPHPISRTPGLAA